MLGRECFLLYEVTDPAGNFITYLPEHLTTLSLRCCRGVIKTPMENMGGRRENRTGLLCSITDRDDIVERLAGEFLYML